MKVQTALGTCVGPTVSEKEINKMRAEMAGLMQLDDLALNLNLITSESRLKIFYLLCELKELCVCDIASILNMKVSSVSQNLSKLKAYKLVSARRSAQTIYYSLTDHKINKAVKKIVMDHLKEAS